MVKTELTGLVSPDTPPNVQVIRHAQVCKKLQVSSAKLFDMIARWHAICSLDAIYCLYGPG